MSIFDIFKGKSPSVSAEDEAVILKKMDIIFEEAISKAEAFEKLGRNDEAMAKYQEGFSRLSEIVKQNSNNYMYPLKNGELIMTLAYTKDKVFFKAAEPWYQMVIKHFHNDKDADLTMAYWRLGLIEERLRNNQKTALSYYNQAISAPKGLKITDYQKKYDLSAVYLSLAILYRFTDDILSKKYARMRLEIVTDCPQAIAIINDYRWEAQMGLFDAVIGDHGEILCNKDQEGIFFILSGPNRTIRIKSTLLSMLLVSAKMNGWNGGKKLFDRHGKMMKFPEKPFIITKLDATTLGKTLTASLVKTEQEIAKDTSPMMREMLETVHFFSEGAFEAYIDQ